MLVAPELSMELTDGNLVFRASCLKFIAVFRNQLPKEQVGALLPNICRHVAVQNAVVHSYAAICLEKLLRVRDSAPDGRKVPRYEPGAVRDLLLQTLDPIVRILAQQGLAIQANEYL